MKYLFGVILFIAYNVDSQNIKPELTEEMVACYKHFHQNPELSFAEKNTSAFIADKFRSYGLEVEEEVGGFGVVGLLENGEGPGLLIRGDMDALPVEEMTDLPYKSTATALNEKGEVVPVMHACGHDIHMSVLLGTAKYLVQNRDTWNGRVMFIAQPAEERGGGSKAMLEDGLYEKYFIPDYALALHVKADLEVGKVAVAPGYSQANVDMADITVYGIGGHGAYPHQTVDPVVLASRIVLALQTVVSREIDPLEPAVVTVGAINGGTKGNVIPEKVELLLTMRSYSTEVRNQIIEAIKRIIHGVASTTTLPEDKYPVLNVRDEFTPSVYNDPKLADNLMTVWKGQLGPENVQETEPTMGGEDFGRFSYNHDEVSLLLYWLGSVEAERLRSLKESKTGVPSLHSAYYYPDAKPTIETGMEVMVSAALHLLKKE